MSTSSTPAPGDPAGSLYRELAERLQGGGMDWLAGMEEAMDGLWYWDLERPEVEWMSGRLKGVLGYAEGEMRNSPEGWRAHAMEEDLAMADANLALHRADERHPYDQVIRFHHRDGSLRWIRRRGRILRNAKGDAVRMLGTHSDVTSILGAEARARAVQEALLDMSFVAHLGDGTLRGGNRAFAEAIGLEVGELTGRDFLSLCHVESRTDAEEGWKALRTEGSVRDLEISLVHRKGTSVPILLNATVVADGGVVLVHAWCREMGHLKRIANLRVLIEMLPNGVVLVDGKGRIVDLNSEAQRMVGYARDELEGREVEVLVPQELRAMHRSERVTYSRKPHSRQMGAGDDLIVRRKDGTTFPAQIGLNPIRTGEGTLVLAIIGDVTERRRMERAIRESEHRFRRLVESLPQMVWTCDSDGACDFLSAQWVRYTGIPEADQLGLRWLAQVHPDDRESLEAAWRLTVAEGSPFRTEFRIRGVDGTYRWFETRAVPVRDGEGRIIKWFGFNTDSTDRRRIEESHLRVQKLEALGTLAGGIAHDFNNILLAINGNTGMAIANLDPGHPVQDHLSEIAKAGMRAADLVRRILAFGRPMEPRHDPVQLPEVVAEALKLVRATLPAMIEIRFEHEAELPPVLADAGQVHQVLVNLATNAAHAIGSRKGRIEVRIEKAFLSSEARAVSPNLAEGLYVRVSVSDNGCGMDRATLERIFDPFFTTKPPGLGTGLGLSIVHGILRSHRGAITAYSQPGKGTVFRLYFPATRDQVAVLEQAPAVAMDLRTERVLFIDDEEALVFLTSKMLASLGCVVTGHLSAADAVEDFRAHPQDFDLVITDLSMPGTTGFDVARELLRIRSDLPIILASGYSRPEDAAEAAQIGIRELLSKPYTLEELAGCLDRVLGPVGNGGESP